MKHRFPETFSADDDRKSSKYGVLPHYTEKKNWKRTPLPIESSLYEPRVKMRKKYSNIKWRNKWPISHPFLLPYTVTNYGSNDFVYEEYDDSANIYNKKDVHHEGSYGDENRHWKNYRMGGDKIFDNTSTAVRSTYNQKRSPSRKYYFDLRLENALNDANMFAKSSTGRSSNRDSLEYELPGSDFSFSERLRRHHGVENQRLSLEPGLAHSTYGVKKFTPHLLEIHAFPTRNENQHRFKFSIAGGTRNSEDENVQRNVAKFHHKKKLRAHSFTPISSNSGRSQQALPNHVDLEDEIMNLTRSQNMENTEHTVYSSRYRDDIVMRNVLNTSKNKTRPTVDGNSFSYSSSKTDNQMQIDSKRNTKIFEQMNSFSLKNVMHPSTLSEESDSDSNGRDSETNLKSDRLLSNELIAYIKASPLIRKEERFAMTAYPFMKQIPERDHFFKSVIPPTEHDFDIDLNPSMSK